MMFIIVKKLCLVFRIILCKNLNADNLSFFCSLRIIGCPTSNDGIDHKNDDHPNSKEMATAVSQDTQRALAQKVIVSLN